jgi:hypothetical protein
MILILINWNAYKERLQPSVITEVLVIQYYCARVSEYLNRYILSHSMCDYRRGLDW